MFEFLFKFPVIVFTKGEFVFLGPRSKWLLVALLLAAAAGLALLMRWRLPRATPLLQGWRASILWLLQTSLAALLLILLWQPTLMVSELKPQQNIIAVVVDDSASMGINENGSTREAQAVKALQGGVLTDLQRRFQTRLYRMDSKLTRVDKVDDLHPSQPVTHIGDSLRQLAAETTDLPIGAVLMLSDGSDNSGGIDLDTISALRSRHIPVHTVGFGSEQSQDIEINDVAVPARTLADSRLAASVTFPTRIRRTQRRARRPRWRKGAHHPGITFGPDGNIQTENVLFNAGAAGAKPLSFSIDPLPGEENRANNAITRLVDVQLG